MGTSRIITKQRVSDYKLQCARELRKQMTEEEVLLWEKMRGSRLNGYHFRRQQIID